MRLLLSLSKYVKNVLFEDNPSIGALFADQYLGGSSKTALRASVERMINCGRPLSFCNRRVLGTKNVFIIWKIYHIVIHLRMDFYTLLVAPY